MYALEATEVFRCCFADRPHGEVENIGETADIGLQVVSSIGLIMLCIPGQAGRGFALPNRR